jgi:hypothetical protein
VSAPHNPPAFPDCEQLSTGMTLRDWFAGQALSQVAASRSEAESWSWEMDEIAADAYALADAMLAARKTGGAA